VKTHSISYHNVPRETFTDINQQFEKHEREFNLYLEQLKWWNRRINLVSRDVSRGTLVEHIRHSLLLAGISVYNSANFVVDAGTGGGLPGIPLAITSPEKKFYLIDIAKKKTMAANRIVHKLSLKNVSVKNISVSDIEIKQPVLLISKHAFKIDELYQKVSSFCWDHLVFYKGADFGEELQRIKTPLTIDVYWLDENNPKDFYQNKAILIISR
jgi:16S rRNA (guanine527-N7)-methyltransferase